MKDEYNYEEILALENINEFSPTQTCNLLALVFEKGRENKEKDAISSGLRLATSRSLEDFSDHEKMIYHYFVANGWAYLHKLTHQINSNDFWAFEASEIENEIINLRKAISFSDKANDPFLLSQVLVNLGITFNHVGRSVEAIHFWHRAMKLHPGFGMAIGNLGLGLAHYAKILFDEGHRFLFCRYAYKYLNEASESNDVYKEGQKAFQDLAVIIEERYGEANLNAEQELNDFTLGRSSQERDYRKWCIENTLFLNPLNDFIYENIVGHDCLFLPTMVLHKDEPPFFHSLYNQIKQEFVSARYLYYQSLTGQKPHFSDKDNMLMDTLEYSVYSLSTEKLKIAFRVCYSIFDKIGYMLNEYLKIGMAPKDVSFRKVWFRKGADKKKMELNPLIAESQNWPLRGLYWISKDLIEDGSDFSESILPEAKQIATIRNFMEHRSLKIVDMGETEIIENGLTYQIQRDELEKKVYILMQMVRLAIMSLSFAIQLEEAKKEKGFSLPISFVEFDYQSKR